MFGDQIAELGMPGVGDSSSAVASSGAREEMAEKSREFIAGGAEVYRR